MKVVKPLSITNEGAFVRSSTASYYDKDGILQYAAIDQPRYTYNPSTLKFEGLINEEEVTNTQIYSEDLSVGSASGGVNANNITKLFESVTNPQGALGAYSFTDATDISPVVHSVTRLVSIEAGKAYTSSFFFKSKASTGRVLKINVATSVQVGVASILVDPLYGEVINVIGSPIYYNVTPLPDGWFRVEISALALIDSIAGGSTLLAFQDLSVGTTYQGTGSESIYLWGLQFEEGERASSYIPTNGAPVTRSADTVVGSGVIYNSMIDGYALWDVGSTYNTGTVIVYQRKTYESLIDSNIGIVPTSDPDSWLETGPSNRWALFDSKISSQSEAVTELIVTIKPGAVDTFALLNLVGSKVHVIMKDSSTGTVIYNQQQSLSGDNPLDWFQYFFFDSTTQRTQAIFTNLSLFGTCEITFRISAAESSPVKVGQVVAGPQTSLGLTQYGLSTGILDFSKKETNEEFGTTEFLIRSFSKRMSPTLLIPTYDLNRVQRTLYNLRAVPALWIASEDPLLEEAVVVFGFYRDFNTEIAYPTYSVCSLEIEGLI